MNIPYGRHEVDADDIAAVTLALRAERLTQGTGVPEFEDSIATYCGVAHGVATGSGTSALHLACLALDVGTGDHVWTSAITFVASANCVRYCGGEVDFVDIDPATWNMSVEALDAKLREAKTAGLLPKVVIPVHLGGVPCEMAAIAALGERYGFRIVEDAAHALGAEGVGHRIGAGAHSDITVFSFHPVKAITTGEGGMALTDDNELAARMRRLRSHGRGDDGLQTELGFNYRMTDLQAALGCSQMRRLDSFISARTRLAARYDDAFADLQLRKQAHPPGVRSAHHLYLIRTEAVRRDRLRQTLDSAGVVAPPHYPPVYAYPFYEAAASCNEADAYAREAITLPLFPTLTTAEQDFVIDLVRTVE